MDRKRTTTNPTTATRSQRKPQKCASNPRKKRQKATPFHTPQKTKLKANRVRWVSSSPIRERHIDRLWKMGFLYFEPVCCPLASLPTRSGCCSGGGSCGVWAWWVDWCDFWLDFLRSALSMGSIIKSVIFVDSCMMFYGCLGC